MPHSFLSKILDKARAPAGLVNFSSGNKISTLESAFDTGIQHKGTSDLRFLLINFPKQQDWSDIGFGPILLGDPNVIFDSISDSNCPNQNILVSCELNYAGIAFNWV
jgi:hypothetical protein